MKYHTPALLQEVVRILAPKDGDLIIDATIGGGGHSLEFVKREARVLGIDRDHEAIEHIRNQFRIGQELVLVKGNFNKIREIAKEYGFGQVDGILFDLGLSGHQLDKASRGFSFQKEGPLDMRADPSLAISAADIVNHFNQRRLYEIFKTFSQAQHSRAIAAFICRARQVEAIESTIDLAKIIDHVVPRQINIKEKARIFQALRIVVNSELLNLEECLPQTVDLLKSGGRLAIISYHSLEDRLVKRFFKLQVKLKVLTPKPIGPTDQEIMDNPQARSAKLRVAEKI